MAFDAIGLYPDWWAGRKFLKPPAIERPFDFLGWAASTTSIKTRSGAQTKLLGDVMQRDQIGTGLIPLDNIQGRPSMARGIADFVDSVSISREIGGRAVIRFKTYEMGRSAFEVEPVDKLWLDEDVKGEQNENIYGECQARMTTTNGQIMVSMTPVLGLTPIRRRFKSKAPGTAEVLLTVDDALVSNGGHIPDEHLTKLLAKYKTDSERMTRLYGADMQGEGAVFETPIEQIKFVRDPAEFPPYWRWLWGLDFRHSGSQASGHPFAAVLGCRDVDNDVIYIVHAERLYGLAPGHVVAIKANPCWTAPVAWPHDGGVGASLISGETIAQVYKGLGLNMRPGHATFPDGGYNFEAGITEMDNRFSSGRLKVAAHLVEWADEYQGYHRVNGVVNKIDDDLLSASRVLCMDIRFAQPWEKFQGFRDRRHQPAQVARDVDFDLFA